MSSNSKTKGKKKTKRFKNEKLYRRINLSFSVLNISVTAGVLLILLLTCFIGLRTWQKEGLINFSELIYNEIYLHEDEILNLSDSERAEYIFDECIVPLGDRKLEVGIAVMDDMNSYSDYRSLSSLLEYAAEEIDSEESEANHDGDIYVHRFKYDTVPYMIIDTQLSLGGYEFEILTFQSTQDTNTYILFLSIILSILFILSLGVMFGLGFLVSRKALAPLEGIANSVKSITEENLSVRLKTQHIDGEVDSLIIALNNMLQRLSVSFEMQKQFVNDVSHEMRIPITIIQGNLDIITSWGMEDENVLNECLEAIEDEVRNMKNLIERLLFIHNVTSGNYEFNLESIRANRLMKKMFNDAELMTQNHNVKLELNLKDDVRIYVDRLALEASIRALIDNSIKYTPENGSIILRGYAEKNMVYLIVEDTGCGIEEENIDKIFTRFFRADSARGRKTGGSGLGLAIVKATVEAMNGTVDIESEYGKWTKAIVTIPQYVSQKQKDDKNARK